VAPLKEKVSAKKMSKKANECQKRIDHFSRIFVPIVIGVFNVVYWQKAIQSGGIAL